MNEINLARIDLNLLVVFAVLYEEKSTTKAGKRLHLSQSAVSHALRRLRDAFGNELFVRVRNNLEPTPRAQSLYRELTPCLETIDMALRKPAAFDPAISDRTFRLGLPSALDVCVTPLLLEHMRKSSPRVRLIIRPVDFRTGAEKLDSGEIELGVSHFGEMERWHRKQEIGLYNFSCLYDARILQTPGPITLEAYLAAGHVLTSFSGDLTGAADTALAKLGLSRRVIASTAEFSSVPFYLAAAGAIATLPTYAARIYAARLGLSCNPVPFEIASFPLSLIWHARADQDEGHIWFRELVASAIAAL